MIRLMRGIRTPVRTTVIVVPARMASNSAGYLPPRSRIRKRALAVGVEPLIDAGDRAQAWAWGLAEDSPLDSIAFYDPWFTEVMPNT